MASLHPLPPPQLPTWPGSWVKGYLFRGWTGVRSGSQLLPSTSGVRDIWGSLPTWYLRSQGSWRGRGSTHCLRDPHSSSVLYLEVPCENNKQFCSLIKRLTMNAILLAHRGWSEDVPKATGLGED